MDVGIEALTFDAHRLSSAPQLCPSLRSQRLKRSPSRKPFIKVATCWLRLTPYLGSSKLHNVAIRHCFFYQHSSIFFPQFIITSSLLFFFLFPISVVSLGIRALQVWALGRDIERFPSLLFLQSSHQFRSLFWCCCSVLLCFAISNSQLPAAARPPAPHLCLISARPLPRPAYYYHTFSILISSEFFCVRNLSYLSTFGALLLGWSLILIASCLRLSKHNFLFHDTNRSTFYSTTTTTKPKESSLTYCRYCLPRRVPAASSNSRPLCRRRESCHLSRWQRTLPLLQCHLRRLRLALPGTMAPLGMMPLLGAMVTPASVWGLPRYLRLSFLRTITRCRLLQLRALPFHLRRAALSGELHQSQTRELCMWVVLILALRKTF